MAFWEGEYNNLGKIWIRDKMRPFLRTIILYPALY